MRFPESEFDPNSPSKIYHNQCRKSSHRKIPKYFSSDSEISLNIYPSARSTMVSFENSAFSPVLGEHFGYGRTDHETMLWRDGPDIFVSGYRVREEYLVATVVAQIGSTMKKQVPHFALHPCRLEPVDGSSYHIFLPGFVHATARSFIRFIRS